MSNNFFLIIFTGNNVLKIFFAFCFFFTSVLAVSGLDQNKQNGISVIPKPLKMKRIDGNFTFNAETVILADEKLKDTAEYLKEQLETATGHDLEIGKAESKEDANVIIFQIKGNMGKEEYSLNVSSDKVVIEASDNAGAFYACQTLKQLMPHQIESRQPVKGIVWVIPCVEIKDKPRFQWRGYMLDSSRYFEDVDYIKKTLDVLALYKINRFHWHLTDDQGWRIEIESHPELLKTGAFRPNANAYLNYKAKEESENYGGYYTKDEIREIVSYAEKRNITIIPEIEMPGHCFSSIMAYPELSCRGGEPEEKGETWIYKDVYCAGNEKVFTLLEDVLDEVIELFPSKWIHIGGDECPKDRWKACPKCQSRIKEEGLKDEDELQGYFAKRIEAILNKKGRVIIGWDELLEGGIGTGAVIQCYRNAQSGAAAANKGNDVIMSHHQYCYLDYNYDSTPIKKAYSYEPVPEGIEDDKGMHILGVEFCQWLGNVSRRYLENHGVIMPSSNIEFQTFPRLIAMSEAGWTSKEAKNWDDFLSRLKEHGKRLDVLDINFYRDYNIWHNSFVTENFLRLWSDPEVEKTISDNIERYRKSDVTLNIVDYKGDSVPSAEIKVEQISHDFLFGSNAFVLGQLKTPEENKKYEEAYLQIFNSTTIPFYWRGTEPTEGELRYEEGSRHIWRRPPPDRLIRWCEENGLVPKGHPLVWFAHNPEWLLDDAEKVKELFIKRFKEISERYSDTIKIWDGVNEPVVCYEKFALCKGKDRDYVAWAFKEERKIFPADSKLMINEMPDVSHEYNGEDPAQTRYFKLTQDAIDQGAVIDGIGFQFHIMSDKAVAEILGGYGYSPRQLFKVYELYDKFQLPMYITEITIPTMDDTPEAELLQKEMVRNYYRLWFSIPRMKGITWWNFGDGTAIENETKFHGGLLKRNLDPKLSYLALDQLINNEWKTDLSLNTDNQGVLKFRGFQGKYRITIKTPDIEKTKEVYVKPDMNNEFIIEIW